MQTEWPQGRLCDDNSDSDITMLASAKFRGKFWTFYDVKFAKTRQDSKAEWTFAEWTFRVLAAMTSLCVLDSHNAFH